jgi:arsenate reductase-like glutaredoxin family protein
MEVQIFGIKKSADTRKALRFFAERRVKTHFVDLQERPALHRFVTTCCATPAGMRLRAAVRRKSWGPATQEPRADHCF